MTRIYTVNFTRANGQPGWTSVWAANNAAARKAIQKRDEVQAVINVVPNV